MTLEEAIALGASPDTVECVIAYRFTGSAKPGCRIDLGCSICGARVALNATSQRMVANGAPVFCLDCWRNIEPRIPEVNWLNPDVAMKHFPRAR